MNNNPIPAMTHQWWLNLSLAAFILFVSWEFTAPQDIRTVLHPVICAQYYTPWYMHSSAPHDIRTVLHPMIFTQHYAPWCTHSTTSHDKRTALHLMVYAQCCTPWYTSSAAPLDVRTVSLQGYAHYCSLRCMRSVHYSALLQVGVGW